MDLEIVEDRREEVKGATDEAITEYLTEVGIHISGEAALALEASPRRIDTGLLRNSLTWALAGQSADKSNYSADSGGGSGSYTGQAPSEIPGERAVYVGTNVEYGPYVHEGTSRMAPNRFLVNAIEWNQEQLREKAKEKLGKIE